MLPHYDKLTLPPLDPAEFATFGLGLDLYDWQRESLEAVGRGEKVALTAANGSGKSAFVVAIANLWLLWAWPKAKGVITSKDGRQIKHQIFPALHAFKSSPLFDAWTWNQIEILTPEGGFIIGFTTDEPGRAEGWHWGGPDAPLMYTVDESKSVADSIFTAVDRCTRQFQLYASSPGPPFGQFYRSFNKERRFFSTFRVTSADCPHIPPEKIEEDRQKYGENHPVFRSMHLAEFTENEDGLVMTPQKARAGISRPASG